MRSVAGPRRGGRCQDRPARLGAIAPGLEISLEALGRRGAQLRKVELARPRTVVAKNTVEALQSGMVFGTAAQVEGLVARMIGELGVPTADVRVISTGYLAPLVVGTATGTTFMLRASTSARPVPAMAVANRMRPTRAVDQLHSRAAGRGSGTWARAQIRSKALGDGAASAMRSASAIRSCSTMARSKPTSSRHPRQLAR